jgi:hypothetical protein
MSTKGPRHLARRLHVRALQKLVVRVAFCDMEGAIGRLARPFPFQSCALPLLLIPVKASQRADA